MYYYKSCGVRASNTSLNKTINWYILDKDTLIKKKKITFIKIATKIHKASGGYETNHIYLKCI